MSNLRTFLLNTAPYRRALRISEYGDPEKDKAALAELSPITYIDKVNAPLLLIQGASDPRVPVGEALQMHDALEKKGATTQMIVFPDEGHGAAKTRCSRSGTRSTGSRCISKENTDPTRAPAARLQRVVKVWQIRTSMS
jgi:dipeptidyl aminopeptidase/acylaminoacyl peptidase